MILVVGGTGTLGHAVVARLAEKGHDLRVLTRDERRAEGLAAEVAVGDLRDVESLTEATRGCSAVVAAAHGFLGGRGAGPEQIDHRGNAALVRAAVAAGVEHVVLISVFGARPDHPLPLHRAKYAAELELQANGLAWTVLRPTSYIETWMPLVAGKVASGGPALVLGRGENPVNFVSVQDVAMLVERALIDPAMRNRMVDVIGPDNLTMTELARRLGATRIRHVPRAALHVATRLLAPVAPGPTRAAEAALAMDTTIMAADPAPLRSAFADVSWHSAGDVAVRWANQRA
jgi:uncharacterized protein YbjT (DUF2867 family)